MGLRIGFDAKRIFHNVTGLGNYGRTLVKNISLHHPSIEIVLFTPSVVVNKDTEWILNQPTIKIVTPPNSSNKTLWRIKGIEKEILDQGINIFHGISNELPRLKKVKELFQVVTIHDLIFKYFKKQYSFSDRMIYNFKSEYAIRRADRVVTISKSTKEDVLRYYAVNEEKIEVIYQSCGIQNQSRLQADKSYFLFVSGLNERKGLRELLQAIKNQNVEKRRLLKVVGCGGNYERLQKQFVKENNLTEFVEFLGSVSNHALTSLYANAIALVYPSFAEGFGIPIIEALSVGTHVITSNHSAMPEAGGSLAHYTEPGNINQLTEMLNKAPNFKALNKIQLSSHLETFNGENTANQMVDMYHNLMK